MIRAILVAAAVVAAVSQDSFAVFPGNGYWGIGPNRQSRTNSAQPVSYRPRSSNMLDVYPRPNPHVDNSLYGRGLSGTSGSAYLTNQYRGSGANMSYGYWDGGFNPGLYGFSMYPHFDRPGFTYWYGGN